jgi:WD40 repeat protein
VSLGCRLATLGKVLHRGRCSQTPLLIPSPCCHGDSKILPKPVTKRIMKVRLLPVFVWFLLSLNISRAAVPEQIGALVVQQGHSSQVKRILTSPDQPFAVSLSEDGVIKVWDLSTRMLFRTLDATNTEAIAFGGAFPRVILLRRKGFDSPQIAESWSLEKGSLEHVLIDSSFFQSNSIPQGHVEATALSSDSRTCAVAVDPGPTLVEMSHKILSSIVKLELKLRKPRWTANHQFAVSNEWFLPETTKLCF